MTHVLRETLRSLRASPIFAFYILVTLGVAGIIGLMTVGVIDLGMNHFGDVSHRTHDVTYGFLFTTGIMGILAQLRRPEKNVAGMLMAVIPAGGLLLAAVLSSQERVVETNPLRYAAAVAVVAVLLHPTGRAFFRSFRVSRVNLPMLVLVGIAAVPLIAFASTNIRLQRTITDAHGGMGHYGFMAAFSFTVVTVGVLGSLRPVGWRLTAWVAGLLPALLGVTSLLYPDAATSLGTGWALVAIAWGVVFLAAAAFAKDAESPPLLGSRGVVSRSEHPLVDAQLSS